MDILKTNIDITHLSNFKTKTTSKYYYEINNIDDIKEIKNIIDFVKKNALWLLFISGWTNILFKFYEFDGVVVKNNLEWFKYDEKTKRLELYSNEIISDVAEVLKYNFGQDLWHRFIGLPGSVWWAIHWNAWCFWLETQDNLIWVEVLNLETNEIEYFKKDGCNFSYRNSIFKETQKYFIIKWDFDLSQKIEKYHSDTDNIDFRENKQPKWNSSGSFFKNPSREYPAGMLIEQVWLKWYHHNTAFFSEKHRNFLMTNIDNWDYKDLIHLIELAQQKVYDKFGLNLINEVRIIENKKF